MQNKAQVLRGTIPSGTSVATITPNACLQKLHASRVIRKDPPLPSSEFKGRYKIAQDKGKYKKKRNIDDLSSDRNSQEELAAQQKPAKSKDKYKKYRDVVMIKGNDT